MIKGIEIRPYQFKVEPVVNERSEGCSRNYAVVGGALKSKEGRDKEHVPHLVAD